jgi:hypothetical protein
VMLSVARGSSQGGSGGTSRTETRGAQTARKRRPHRWP